MNCSVRKEKHNTRVLYHSYFKSSRERLAPAVRSLMDVIISEQIPLPLEPDELRLVIDEALTNCMEHGNNWNSEKKVEVDIILDDKALHIMMRDQGEGFDPAPLLKTRKCAHPVARGWGLHLINHFCHPHWSQDGRRLHIPLPLQH